MRRQRLFYITLVLALALLGFFGTGWAQAGPITYQVTVDTSTLSGSSGYLDVGFNAGEIGAALATATITDFSPAANLNPSDSNDSAFGDVTGTLSGTLALTNDTITDYFEAFTYGKSIGFNVTLSGPALDSSGPPPLDGIGSSFAFSLYDSTGTVPLLTTDPNGSVLTVNVNGNGSTSVETFPETSNPGSPYAASAVPLGSSVPAPPSIVLLVFAVPAGLIYWRRSRLTLSKAPS